MARISVDVMRGKYFYKTIAVNVRGRMNPFGKDKKEIIDLGDVEKAVYEKLPSLRNRNDVRILFNL